MVDIPYVDAFILLASLGEGIVAPVLPLYANSIGAGYAELGYLVAVFSIFYTASAAAVGPLADVFGRKRMLMAGALILFSASGGYFISDALWQIFLFKGLEGLARGIIWPVSEAVIADEARAHEREKAAGLFSACYGIGLTVGTVLSGYLCVSLGYKITFLLYPMSLSIAFFGFVCRMKPSSSVSRVRLSSVYAFRPYVECVVSIWQACAVGLAYTGFLWSISGLFSTVSVRHEVTLEATGVLYGFLWSSRLLAFFAIHAVARRVGQRCILFSAMLLCLVSSLILARWVGFTYFSICMVLAGLGTGLAYPASIAFVGDLTDPDRMGLAMGIMETFMGLGMIIQPAVAGVLGERFGIGSTYVFSSVVIGASALAVLWRKPRRRKSATAM